MKFRYICLSSMLIYGMYAAPSWAEAVLTSKAYVDNKVPAYASGGSASLLTDTDTTGTIAKRAIFTDGTTYVAGTHANQIPTMGAVMSAVSAGVSGADISSHTVNGAPLSNSSSYFYGESASSGTDNPKVVTIASLSALAPGQLIIIKPANTSTVATANLQVKNASNNTLSYNNTDSFPLKYGTDTAKVKNMWRANVPSIWVFDGTAWVFAGYGTYNTNTTYAALEVQDGITGTATDLKSVRADYLKQIIQGTTLTGLSTADATAVAATDSITTGIGKLQAQITSVSGDIPTLPTGTTDSVVTYGANGTFGERGVETSSLGTSTSATTLPTTGVVVSAFNTKFPANGGTNKVVTLSSTAGAPSSRNIVTTLTSGGTNIPTDGAVYSAVDAKQDKATCTEYKPNSNNTICYAYTFADISTQQQSTKTQGEITEDPKATKP